MTSLFKQSFLARSIFTRFIVYQGQSLLKIVFPKAQIVIHERVRNGALIITSALFLREFVASKFGVIIFLCALDTAAMKNSCIELAVYLMSLMFEEAIVYM